MGSEAELGLGTVQWGMRYGIANSGYRTTALDVSEILNLARHYGIRILDTAAQYGNAESVLGCEELDEFLVVTKTPRFNQSMISSSDSEHLVASFRTSLERLSCKQIFGLLIHNADDLLSPGAELLVRSMKELKDQGLIKKIGVSVYDGKQLDAVLRLFYPDIVQLPLSVLDQRLLISGHVSRLKEAGIQIHARSVFLQGLLLMPIEKIPPFFSPIQKDLLRWRQAVDEQCMSPSQASLSFVRDCPGVDVVLVGVETVRQFESCVADFRIENSFDAAGFSLNDSRYLNPVNWAFV